MIQRESYFHWFDWKDVFCLFVCLFVLFFPFLGLAELLEITKQN